MDDLVNYQAVFFKLQSNISQLNFLKYHLLN